MLLRCTVSSAFLQSMAVTQSGWVHSAPLRLSCWNLYTWSVAEEPGLKPAWSTDWLASDVGCRRPEEELAEEFIQDGDRTDGSVLGRGRGSGNTWTKQKKTLERASSHTTGHQLTIDTASMWSRLRFQNRARSVRQRQPRQLFFTVHLTGSIH